MKLLYNILFICLVMISCSKQSKKEILGKEKMIEMITEVSLADAYAEVYILKDSTLKRDSVLQQELNAVYKINQVTQNQFAESYHFYSSNPKIFKEIIDSAHARAYRKKDKIYLSTTAK